MALSLPAVDALLMVPILVLQPLAAALLLLRATDAATAVVAAVAAAAPALAEATDERGGGPRRGSIEQPSMVVRQHNTHYRAS